jgi:hypothetical protein
VRRRRGGSAGKIEGIIGIGLNVGSLVVVPFFPPPPVAAESLISLKALRVLFLPFPLLPPNPILSQN